MQKNIFLYLFYIYLYSFILHTYKLCFCPILIWKRYSIDKYFVILIETTQRENLGSLAQVHQDHLRSVWLVFIEMQFTGHKIHLFKVYNSMLVLVFYKIVQQITTIQLQTATLKQTKRFCIQNSNNNKSPINGVKRQRKEWEKIFATMYPKRGNF